MAIITRSTSTYIITNVGSKSISINIKKQQIDGLGLLEDKSGPISIAAGTTTEVEQNRVNKKNILNLANVRPKILEFRESRLTYTVTVADTGT